MLHIVLTASVYVGCMCVLLMHLFFSDQLSYPRSQENTATRASNETAVVTSSSAVAERPRDASCLSVYIQRQVYRPISSAVWLQIHRYVIIQLNSVLLSTAYTCSVD